MRKLKFIEMKEKIKNALKTEYAKMGLGDKAFDGVASFLVKTITKEEEIDGVIKSEDTKNLLKAVQGETDSLRNRAAQLEKDFNAYKEKNPEGGKATGKEDDLEPSWVKELKEQYAGLTARLDAEEKANAVKRSRDAVEARLKAAGCINPGILRSTLKGFAMGENETEDAAVERLKTEYNSNYKETFGDGPIPPFGGHDFPDAKTALERKNEFLRSQGLLPDKKE